MTTTTAAVSSAGRDDWLQLLAAQHGVVHRSDVPRDELRHVTSAIRRGVWQRASRDVFVNHNGPLTEQQRLWVVLKAAPPVSALSGLTAAKLGGLQGFDESTISVTVPCATSMPRVHIGPVSVHYSRFLDGRDVHPVLSPRRTRLARSLLDAAAWASVENRGRAVILAGIQQGLVTPDGLREALPRRGPCLRHALITETIDDAAGGVRSVPEREFDAIRRAFGLPEPNRQQIVRRASGRYYLDVDWADYGIASEVDGLPHMSILHWDADLDRMNEIAIEHRALLRFTSFAIRHRRPDVGRTLTRALMSRGWS
jgi:hypothetical protein